MNIGRKSPILMKLSRLETKVQKRRQRRQARKKPRRRRRGLKEGRERHRRPGEVDVADCHNS